MFELVDLSDSPKMPLRVISVGDASNASLANKLSAERLDDVSEYSGTEAPFHVCFICYGRDLEVYRERIMQFVVGASYEGVPPTTYVYIGLVDDRDVVPDQVLDEYRREVGVAFLYAEDLAKEWGLEEIDLCLLTKNVSEILSNRSSLICYDYGYIREMSSGGGFGVLANTVATGENATRKSIRDSLNTIQARSPDSVACLGVVIVLTAAVDVSVKEIEQLAIEQYGWGGDFPRLYCVFLDENMPEGSRHSFVCVIR